MEEPKEVRLARIEEGMIRIHERISSNHNEVMGLLKPVVAEVQKQRDFRVASKAHHRWVLWLAGAALAIACASIERSCSVAPAIATTESVK